METEAANRRRYRFRAWHKLERQIYPVLMVGRGGVLLQDSAFERTCLNADVVLMQYSGLSDASGREIYEGDILAIANSRGTVTLKDGAFRLQSADSNQAQPLTQDLIDRHHVRVIGNIYQNGATKPAKS